MRMKAARTDDRDIDAWIDTMIDDQGYAQVSMHGSNPGEPGYAFTIGLGAAFGAPDLFCMGVAPDIAARIFGISTTALHDGRLQPKLPDADIAGLVAGFRLRFRGLPATQARLLITPAGDRLGPRPRLVHVQLPDAAGLFPDDPACNPAYRTAQDVDRLLATVH